jgi:preprotein translocase subunit SecF
MKFNISEKIEEVRQKPEHIRMRYVWFWLAVSMAFVVLIWIFSVKENFRSINFDGGQLPEISNPLPEIKQELPSMESIQKSLTDEAANQQK